MVLSIHFPEGGQGSDASDPLSLPKRLDTFAAVIISAASQSRQPCESQCESLIELFKKHTHSSYDDDDDDDDDEEDDDDDDDDDDDGGGGDDMYMIGIYVYNILYALACTCAYLHLYVYLYV